MAVNDYDPIIQQAADEWNIDPAWLKGVMQTESGGNPVDKNGNPIRSSAGAGGLMQIMPETAAGLGVQNVDDPTQNIFGAAKLLSQLRDKYSNTANPVAVATAAYNAKPSTVDGWLAGTNDLPAQTKAYVPAVAAAYAKYRPATAQAAQTGALPDADFLRATGAAPSSVSGVAAPANAPVPATASDADFLKMTGATGPAASSPVAQPGVADQSPSFELGAAPAGPAFQGPSPTTILSAVAEGAKQGWNNTPDILTPTASAWLTAHGLGAIGNNTGLPSYALKALAAGGNALQSGIAQAGSVAGVPLLGRDLAAFPEAFAPGLPGNPLIARPMTRTEPLAADTAQGGAVRNPLASGPAPNPLASPSVDMTPAYIRRGVDPVTGQTIAPGASPLSSAVPLQAPAAPSVIAPGPQSLGAAATPATFVNMTPAEALASRSTGEMQRVLAPAKEGVDTTVYVPGTQPTEAEVSGNPTVAAEQKFNRSRNPDPHIAQETANNAARVEYYEQTAGTPTQVERLKDARDQQAQADLRAAFGNKSAADPQPVADTINGILNDPRLGERDAVQKFVAPYLDKLKNADGTLKTDPEALYGIRENITDQLAKNGDPQNAGARQVRRQLMAVKGAFDDAIEAAAPGYRQYLDNYSSASQPIEAMEYLQDARPSLTNAQGTMTPAAFDRFMKNTVADRAAGGISPAASLTEDQMDALHNIHSDLKRFQNINLSNPRGSDTNMLGHIASKGGELAAHAAANVVSPLVGSIAVQMGKQVLEKRRTERMTQRVLNPNPLKYPPSQGP
jgi:transglycosylase-like protein with SLT domain